MVVLAFCILIMKTTASQLIVEKISANQFSSPARTITIIVAHHGLVSVQKLAAGTCLLVLYLVELDCSQFAM